MSEREYSALCPGKVNKVRPVLSLLRSLTQGANFCVRLAASQWLMNNIYYWYKLTAGVRARLKAVSGCTLRTPIRPKPAALCRTHLTNTCGLNQSTELIGSSFDAYLDAFFGALKSSYQHFVCPLMGKPGNQATPFRGYLNTKSTENVYRA